jgi:hypothetical protein
MNAINFEVKLAGLDVRIEEIDREVEAVKAGNGTVDEVRKLRRRQEFLMAQRAILLRDAGVDHDSIPLTPENEVASIDRRLDHLAWLLLSPDSSVSKDYRARFPQWVELVTERQQTLVAQRNSLLNR